ncbi:M48 family metallopeptidase [Neolewinella litorea]|uniref:M48 family peptidase n=1 Tax=Neolewinella litorea TaxID=2562452 RepID=A0A4S4NLY4_9BACT|nr:YgjP-like metallopeptidase domain-containing protein [Neolewinella litorea]THH39348.1 M48 family peptidase [Neolewinella litorea]
MPRTRKTGEHRSTLDLNGIPVPLRIITERGRRSTIASVRQRALYIRLPAALSKGERERRITEMLDWARRTAAEKPEAFAHFVPPPAAGAYTFAFRGHEYRITVEAHDGATHRIVATPDLGLRVALSTRDPRPNPTQAIPRLLAKHFGRRYLPEVSRRVHELNDRHFKRTIRAVKLSDTYSRWGSCSHLGNINLATRLLLAPPEVLDAVIIHELAHLVVADHSARFWAEVARALPEYERYDQWLRENGNGLRFDPQVLG